MTLLQIKRWLIIPALALACLPLYAQTDGMSYQAVIISDKPNEIPGVDLTGAYLSEAEVVLRFTIIDQSGDYEYQETQTTVTDPYGMINVIIGQGTMTSASNMAFNQIDWDGTPRDLMVELDMNGTGFSEFSQQQLLFVPYAYHRNITATGTLEVDQATTLNSSLTVTGQSPTDLTGSLTVGENAVLQGSLYVQGSAADISGTLDVDGDFTVNSTSDLNGQVTINGGTSGSETDYDAYALRVEGTDQGIAVKLNGTPTASDNFMTFMSQSGAALGRIEGQSYTDLLNSYEYGYEEALYWWELGFMTAEGLACAFQLDAAEATMISAQLVIRGFVFQNHVDYQADNYGAYFSSGGADYAEWIERADLTESFRPGDVVGIKNGKLTLKTAGADHLKVISTNPIVLGNQPSPGQEHFAERVAFLGQVPVKVIGKVSQGDYIVPSGNNDGLAVAYPTDDLPTDRFDEIIGIAWENGRQGNVNMINMAIGMNNNDVADRLAQLENRLESIEARIESMVNGQGQVAAKKEELQPAAGATGLRRISIGMSQEEFNEWLDRNAIIFEALMEQYRNELAARGTDYSAYPDLHNMIYKPTETLREMYAGTKMTTFWKKMEQDYLSK
jgi:hypothetical protein